MASMVCKKRMLTVTERKEPHARKTFGGLRQCYEAGSYAKYLAIQEEARLLISTAVRTHQNNLGLLA
jgi:hypothetical protein